jgi:DNA helicase-2/ATP-dependent DNA helicase PcrA
VERTVISHTTKITKGLRYLNDKVLPTYAQLSFTTRQTTAKCAIINSVKNANDILLGLDEQQRQVAEALLGPVCILAGAGTGKTRAMMHRIAYGVQTNTYAAENVLAITFTAKAAGEMRMRLRALGVDGVNAKTFHAEAFSELRQFWKRISKAPTPSIVGEKMEIVREVLKVMGTDPTTQLTEDIASEIEWTKVSLIAPEDYPKIAKTRELARKFDAERFVNVINAYEKVKAKSNLIDFEDCLLIMAYLIGENKDVAREVRAKYKYFVVDEYQDVSPLQQFMLNQWLGGRKDICVVGDPSQTIYSFTGATPHFLINFKDEYDDTKVIKLYKDYRSTPQIVMLANRTLAKRDLVEFDQLHLISNKERGNRIVLKHYETDVEEAEKIVEDIEKLLASKTNGIDKKDIAILYRQNSQRTMFKRELDAHGIETQIFPSTAYFSEDTVKKMINRVKYASIAEPEDSDFTAVIEKLVQDEKIDNENAEKPDKRANILLDAFLTIKDDFLKQYSETDTATSVKVPVKGLETNKKLRDFLAYIKERTQNQAEPTLDAVTLATLHASKGLEWKMVYLVGVYDGMLPIRRAQTEANIEEERRLFYVGITRAAERLQISYANSHLGNARDRRNRSRFLDGIY